MTTTYFQAAVAGSMLAIAVAVVSAAAGADASVGTGPGETVVVEDVLGPEGPLYVDGNLYYVGWISNTLTRWDGKIATVLNNAAGCGHNGLALTKRKTFLIACTNDPGAILETDMNGKQLRRWDTDSQGGKFAGGINDIVVTANGGAFATIFGVFAERPAAVMGRILYLAPGGQQWREVARDLNYANGIGVSPDQKTLYVSETVGNCILKFSINADGTLSHRSNFALLSTLTKNSSDSPWLGPDSMKIDGMGNIYVAQWAGGRILKISPAGKRLYQFNIVAGKGTTNVAFGVDDKELYVTVVKDPDDPQARGSVVRVANVEAATSAGARPVMRPDELHDFTARYTAAWCSRNADSVAAFFSAAGSLKINAGSPAVGRTAIAAAAQGFMTAFPDLVVMMDGVSVNEGHIAYHWTLTGTNTGPGGTGRPVRISGYEEWRFGDDGLITESLGHFDTADWDRQVNAGAAGAR